MDRVDEEGALSGMAADRDRTLREQVTALLGGHGAHEPLDRILAGVSEAVRGTRPDGLAHSPWEVLEHLRIAQWDILEYTRDATLVSPDWPSGYWPDSPQPPHANAWQQSVEAFANDLRAMQDLVSDPHIDLVAQIPHAEKGHTVLREALVLADHNAYHGGEMVVVRRALRAW
jgi:hypothetical protein